MNRKVKIGLSIAIVFILAVISVFTMLFIKSREKSILVAGTENVYIGDIQGNGKTDIDSDNAQNQSENLNTESNEPVKNETKSLTIEELEKQIEKAKPRFNLDIKTFKNPKNGELLKLETLFAGLDVNGKVSYAEQLSEEDIKRLQNYEIQGLKKFAYIGFEDYDKNKAATWIKDIIPESFPTYKGAYVKWLTSSELVYRDGIGYTHIRGTLLLKYFKDDNRFKLPKDKFYAIDTEIVVSYTDNQDGTTSLKLNKIDYLSNPKEVVVNE